MLYENSFVPVGESALEAKPYKILIESEDYNARKTKASQNWQGSQRLEVIYEGPDNVKKHVDAIRSLVMDLIEPTLYTKGLPDSETWQITNLICTPKQILDDLAADGNYIKRAPLLIEFMIIETL